MQKASSLFALFVSCLALNACSDSLEEKVSKKAAYVLSCPFSEEYFRQSGDSREMCKDVSKFAFESALEKCFDDFYDSNFSEYEMNRFSNLCMLNWLERQELEIQKEKAAFHMSKINK